MKLASYIFGFLSTSLIVNFVVGPLEAQTRSTPTTYQVSIQQVELCEDSACNISVVLGSSTRSFDIAAQNAGSQVGSYAGTSGLTAGTTYSAVKVTLSRSIELAGTNADPGGIGGTCDTDSANDGGAAAAFASLADGDEADGNGDGAEPQTLIAPNPTGTNLGNISTLYTNENITITNNVAGMEIIYPLTAPYTVGEIEPRVEISFDVTNALGAVNDGANACEMFPYPPNVTITLSDP